MSKSIPPILVCIVACIALSAFSVAEPLHYRLASDPTVRGKSKDGQCMDYAIALSSRLAAHGIHGQLIFYRWHIANSEIRGSHVFVMYHLPDDTEWIVAGPPAGKVKRKNGSEAAAAMSKEVKLKGNENARLFLNSNPLRAPGRKPNTIVRLC